MTATLSPAPTSHYPSFDTMPIAGQWRSGGSKLSNTVIDPYRGDTLAVIGEADPADVDEAYNAAQMAQDHWASTTPGERAGVMQRAAAILVERRSEVVDWLVREGGSTLAKAQIEWDIVRQGLYEAAGMPYHADGRIIPSDIPGKENRIYRRPAGVVTVISPWNFPLWLSNRSVAPALAQINRPLRVLIVDDQEVICELIAEQLQGDGHTTAIAICGDDASAKRQVAGLIQGALREPLLAGGRELFVTGSIGISI